VADSGARRQSVARCVGQAPPGRLEKHLAGPERALFLARDFRDDLAVEHVHQHETRVPMCGSDAAGQIVNVTHRDFPFLHVKSGRSCLNTGALAGCGA
jgi:hypothetical protein